MVGGPLGVDLANLKPGSGEMLGLEELVGSVQRKQLSLSP